MENKEQAIPGNLPAYISDGTPQAIIDRYASLAAYAAQSDFGEFDTDIVVIDTETTGFSFNHDELTQIAAARVDKGEIVDWYVTFVNPDKPIPEEVAHLTNIHDSDVADAPSPSEALAGLVEFVGSSKLVAHNAAFDRTFTTRHPSGYPLLQNVWLDSLDLARIALPRLKSHRLIDLVRTFGAPVSTHRADDDVAATCAVLRILLAAVDAMPKPLVAKIASLTTPDQWPTQVVFDYFAQHSARPKGEEESNDSVETSTALSDVSRETSDGQLTWATGPLDLFSLQALRRDRLHKIEYRPKIDADAIASDPARELQYPCKEEIDAAFTPSGLVGNLYDAYEPRAEQLSMSMAVRDAFEASENLVVEAGTGVGKSMAYLVPLAKTAQRNNVTVGVATKTNALLDQLVYKEVPALAAALQKENPDARPLTCAPLKGFAHYPCLRKIRSVVEEGAQTKEIQGKELSQAPAMAALLSFVEQTEYDDIDGLKLDYRLLPRKVITTTSQECLRRKCPFFGNLCFVHGARKRAEAADILVTNHSLLFCDMAADGGLLPPVRYWAIDEAHGAEAEARRAFSIELDAESILRDARRVAADDARRNVFSHAERRVVLKNAKEESETLFFALMQKGKTAGEAYRQAAEVFCASLKGLLFFDTNRRGRSYEVVELWVNDDIRKSATFADIVEKGTVLREAAEKLITACQNLVAYLEDIDDAAAVQREIAALAIDLKDQVSAVDVILENPGEGFAYSATLCRKRDKIAEKLEGLPINVGGKLNDTLYATTHSVVFASATLSVNGKFDGFTSAMGLGQSEFSPVRTCQLDSSYDFDKNMTVYVVSDMPEPNEGGYMAALQKLLVEAHRAQRGSMLTLFTNRREMETCFDYVQPRLKADDLRVVCQKWGVSVKGLRDDFLADEHLSLFALKSFWEGFDAPGATLKGVVIPKLPFAKPTDPLSCARVERDDQAWRHYVLPAAVLEVKQAAGRLIRRADDTGALILADHRLVSKGYGKTFLSSLPSKNIKIMKAHEIVAELEAANVR